MSRTGYSVEIRLERWTAPDSQADRDSGMTTQRESLAAHYDGSRSEAEARALFAELDATMKSEARESRPAPPLELGLTPFELHAMNNYREHLLSLRANPAAHGEQE